MASLGVEADRRGRYRGERLEVPTLILHGAADRAVRPAILHGYKDHADDMRLELIPGAHFVCDDEPELVAERMQAFLAKPDQRAEEPVEADALATAGAS